MIRDLINSFVLLMMYYYLHFSRIILQFLAKTLTRRKRVFSISSPISARLSERGIWKCFIHKMGLHGKIIKVRNDYHDKMLVRLSSYDDIVALFGRSAERWVKRLLLSLKSGSTFLDIGAHIGRYSLLAAKRVGPTGIVLAVEPDNDNFRLLKANLILNGYQNVICLQMALSNYEGVIKLFKANDTGMHSIIRNWTDHRYSMIDSINITCKTLDYLLCRYNIESVDLVKIDVEGAELNVLRGAIKSIKAGKILRILCEVHEPIITTEDIKIFLEKYGFKTTIIPPLVYAYKQNKLSKNTKNRR